MTGSGNLRGTVGWAVFCMVCAGCGRPMLIVDDALVRPDGSTVLTARLLRMSVASMHEARPDETVQFFLDGRSVGQARTDEEGLAGVACKVPDGTTPHIKAVTISEKTRLEAEADLFRWPADRTVIVVDIDGTISRTDYKEVLLGYQDDGSEPMRHSARTLRRWTEDYTIAYLTARPRILLDKTRQWLETHGYPRGVVLVAPRTRQLLRQRRYKTQMLHTLRRHWPNVRIGIGNTGSDAHAYGANDMLSVVVAPEPDDDFGYHSIQLRNWEAMSRLFAANHDLFTDPTRLEHAIESGGQVVLPLTRYVPGDD